MACSRSRQGRRPSGEAEPENHHVGSSSRETHPRCSPPFTISWMCCDVVTSCPFHPALSGGGGAQGAGHRKNKWDLMKLDVMLMCHATHQKTGSGFFARQAPHTRPTVPHVTGALATPLWAEAPGPDWPESAPWSTWDTCRLHELKQKRTDGCRHHTQGEQEVCSRGGASASFFNSC